MMRSSSYSRRCRTRSGITSSYRKRKRRLNLWPSSSTNNLPSEVCAISEKHHPLAVRRNMRKPIILFVEENLLLLATVGLHAPDLHVAGALGVEVNIFTVR